MVEISGECEFVIVIFVKNRKQKASDQMVLMKVVFANNSEDARRKMLKTKNLDLKTARKILEDDEILKTTEEMLDFRESHKRGKCYSKVEQQQEITGMAAIISTVTKRPK